MHILQYWKLGNFSTDKYNYLFSFDLILMKMLFVRFTQTEKVFYFKYL